MSGISLSSVKQLKKGNVVEKFKRAVEQLNEESLTKIIGVWNCIYGEDDENQAERLGKIENDLKAFWENEIDAQEARRQSLIASIEQTGKEALKLERALGLSSGFNGVQYDDKPLVEVEEHVWKILNSYEEAKDKRLSEYKVMYEKEKELCSVLEEEIQFKDLSAATVANYVPTGEEMEALSQRVKDLKRLKDQLEYDFDHFRYELQSLMSECEVLPLSRDERFACSDDDEAINFPCTKQNLEKLKFSTKKYTNMKEQMSLEADELRREIMSLSKKMMKDPEEVQNFINQYSGFKKSTLEKLKAHLHALKEERKHKLKELILRQRDLLDEWWTRCCYSDEQRSQFRPYQVNHYSEEVLNLHEIEAEQLEMFYNEYKRIFQLAEKHDELWKRLLHLEDLATQTDRLFSNRGGRLLQEEKERKVIQKKLPAIKAELITMLTKFKAENGKDFLYFGKPLQEKIEEMEEQRELSKENQKMMRKAANTEHLLLESKLGVRPMVGSKRKMTPQHPNVTCKMTKTVHSTTSSSNSTASTKSSASSSHLPKSTKVVKEDQWLKTKNTRTKPPTPMYSGYATVRTPVKTPAASTPENGSPSYESFQEHIEKSNGKSVMCPNSTKINSERALRPRNLNETRTMTPYKTPKTPVKTPSKIPFRIATGSKIPSVVPPISPRSATKLTTPRSRLPIIF